MWLVFYSNETYLSSETHTPFSIGRPFRRGVQVIIQDTHPEIGWHTVNGNDYYVWRDGSWWGVDIFGLHDYLLGAGEKCVLFGESIDNLTYRRICERAQKMMGDKTGYLPNERHP